MSHAREISAFRQLFGNYDLESLDHILVEAWLTTDHITHCWDFQIIYRMPEMLAFRRAFFGLLKIRQLARSLTVFHGLQYFGPNYFSKSDHVRFCFHSLVVQIHIQIRMTTILVWHMVSRWQVFITFGWKPRIRSPTFKFAVWSQPTVRELTTHIFPVSFLHNIITFTQPTHFSSHFDPCVFTLRSSCAVNRICFLRSPSSSFIWALLPIPN